jgi:hypothetical protein
MIYLRNFEEELELFRRIDYCKEVFWKTEPFDINKEKKNNLIKAMYEFYKDRGKLKFPTSFKDQEESDKKKNKDE